MRLLTTILIIPTIAILFADPPDWQDDPDAYQFTATISGGIVLNIAGEQMGECETNSGDPAYACIDDTQDIFAAFDEEGNVRGVGIMLFPPFGPYQGTPVFEVQLRSNNARDILHFKYYDASKDAILNVAETYELIINEIMGDVQNPMIYNFVPITLSFTNVSSTGIDINYESNTEIAGFQFTVEENVPITGVYDGAAGDAGFTLTTSNNLILGFSLSGTAIAAGSGTLITLEFGELGEDNTLDVYNVVISGPDGSSILRSGPESIAINSPPEQFQFYQSTLQAFYYFNSVLINGTEVEPNDWVGAFKGDICVGARQWDTSQCGGGICNVPAMGDDGSEDTNGYMQIGDIPTFKIYDASENLYYTAESSENSVWFSNGMPIAEILSANVSIPGCTDPDYCNYDPSATEDDGSCNYLCTGCTDIGACNYSENATIDDGSCYYEGIYDCDGNCIADIDCTGECGGEAVLDLCNVCGGDDNSCEDCAGTPNGNASEDNCGICDDNPTNDCVQDCNGNWGGDAELDDCGVCGGTAVVESDCECEVDVVMDCAGLCGGTAVNDECVSESAPDGICGGDSTACADCLGVPNGSNVEDNCGTCDADSSNDCIQGCDGIWGSELMVDICEICGGNGPEENYDCEWNCIGEVNCLGECDSPNGESSPSFQCENGNVVCNPADCNLDISLYLLPDEFGINKIFPNPFNPVTQIQYEIALYGLVSIILFDIRGREVDQLIHEYQSPGHYNITWNAGNHASGMYIVELVIQSDNSAILRDLKKILYLK